MASAHGAVVCGLIPAHAGKTRWRSSCHQCLAAHPRSRGENAPTGVDVLLPPGSSPLTRGKLISAASGLAGGRLIPAHAGKTHSSPHSSNYCRAHPRSRGENTWLHKDTGLPTGSSPLTRGKLARHGRRHRRTGLIPAHAGKTRSLISSPGRGTAHPRSRGENSGLRCRSRIMSGSSPLTRGKPAQHRDTETAPRLIPAHAGKTSSRGPRNSAWTAHPRSRGENTMADGAPVPDHGSSPLTRGKRDPPCARGR